MEQQLAAEAAVVQVAAEKREVAQQAIHDREKRAKKMERDREEEIKRKKDVIRQIQAMEKLANTRAKRPKEFDPTQSRFDETVKPLCCYTLCA